MPRLLAAGCVAVVSIQFKFLFADMLRLNLPQCRKLMFIDIHRIVFLIQLAYHENPILNDH